MMIGPTNELPQTTFGLEEAAEQLGVSETVVREWFATFNWERRYDGDGHLYLTVRDLDFLRVVKSLREVDRSCESIVRIIHDEPITHHVIVVEAPAAETAESLAERTSDNGRAQIETLKAELKELHATPAKRPFWQFW